jgi:hypothetical protein
MWFKEKHTELSAPYWTDSGLIRVGFASEHRPNKINHYPCTLSFSAHSNQVNKVHLTNSERFYL